MSTVKSERKPKKHAIEFDLLRLKECGLRLSTAKDILLMSKEIIEFGLTPKQIGRLKLTSDQVDYINDLATSIKAIKEKSKRIAELQQEIFERGSDVAELRSNIKKLEEEIEQIRIDEYAEIEFRQSDRDTFDITIRRLDYNGQRQARAKRSHTPSLSQLTSAEIEENSGGVETTG